MCVSLCGCEFSTKLDKIPHMRIIFISTTTETNHFPKIHKWVSRYFDQEISNIFTFSTILSHPCVFQDCFMQISFLLVRILFYRHLDFRLSYPVLSSENTIYDLYVYKICFHRHCYHASHNVSVCTPIVLLDYRQ